MLATRWLVGLYKLPSILVLKQKGHGERLWAVGTPARGLTDLDYDNRPGLREAHPARERVACGGRTHRQPGKAEGGWEPPFPDGGDRPNQEHRCAVGWRTAAEREGFQRLDGESEPILIRPVGPVPRARW